MSYIDDIRNKSQKALSDNSNALISKAKKLIEDAAAEGYNGVDVPYDEKYFNCINFVIKHFKSQGFKVCKKTIHYCSMIDDHVLEIKW